MGRPPRAILLGAWGHGARWPAACRQPFTRPMPVILPHRQVEFGSREGNNKLAIHSTLNHNKVTVAWLGCLGAMVTGIGKATEEQHAGYNIIRLLFPQSCPPPPVPPSSHQPTTVTHHPPHCPLAPSPPLQALSDPPPLTWARRLAIGNAYYQPSLGL